MSLHRGMKMDQANRVVRWEDLVRPAKVRLVAITSIKNGLLYVGLFCVMLICSPRLYASTVEGVAAYYADVGRTVLVSSATGTYATRDLWPGRGRETGLSLGYTGKVIDQVESNELLNDAVGKEITKYSENYLSLSLDQGLQVGTLVGVLGGLSQSPFGRTYYFGARGGQWFLSETFQTTLEIRKTVSRVPIIEFTDTDGKRVTTPADLDGLSVSASMTHLTTPSTILLGSLSRSTRNDRPPADAVAIEVRQYVQSTKSAIHFGLAHYENVGRIAPITQVGSVVSNTLRGEWHQRLPRRMIVMAGYRYHLETENPRAADAATRQTGSDSIYGSWRLRLGRGAWTASSHEVYSFLARYTTNAEGLAYVVGIGGKYFF